MKKLILSFLMLFLLGILILAFYPEKPDITEPVVSERQGVAVVMTGAAARIPQEAALLEELDRRGLLKDLVFVSGVSSGALNAVMLNGIKSRRLSWEQYRKILFGLSNQDIFIKEGRKLPLNTAPARALFRSVVEDTLGFHQIGDLPLTTSISFTHLKDLDLEKTVFRMCSRPINQESDTSLGLVDIMMASSAFPLVFPPVLIPHVHTIPETKYVDGGVGEDHVPFRALLEFEKYRGKGVEKVFIVSRMSDSIPQVSEELKGLGINDRGIFDKMGISFDEMMEKGILKGMADFALAAPELAERTYVWIPDLDRNFLLFNFDDLQSQYLLTSQWAKINNPVPLIDYLKKKGSGRAEEKEPSQRK